MSSWKKAAKANQKTHKERHQPESRKHLGLLEKKKDYKKRADDYHEKGATLKLLRKRTLERNPDEFYFHMINSRVKNGEHHEIEKEEDEHTPQQLQLMQTQDLKYVNMKRTIETRRIQRLQSQLHMTDVADSTPNTHIFFVDEGEEKNFDLAKRLDTHPSLINRKSNRPRLSEMNKVALPEVEEVINSTKKMKQKMYNELSKRIEREKELTVVQQKIELKRHLQNTKAMKPKRIRKGTAVSAPVFKFQFMRKK